LLPGAVQESKNILGEKHQMPYSNTANTILSYFYSIIIQKPIFLSSSSYGRYGSFPAFNVYWPSGLEPEIEGGKIFTISISLMVLFVAGFLMEF
jgi:hypothetical protein